MARTGSRFTWRVGFLALVLTAATFGIIGRLVYVQILHHQRYWIEAQDEHLDKRLVHAERGAILDRNGFPLATALDVFDIYIDRRVWLESPLARQRVATQLAPLINVQPDKLLTRLADDSHGPVELIAAGVDF